jgi:hypothetical protein
VCGLPRIRELTRPERERVQLRVLPGADAAADADSELRAGLGRCSLT